MRVTRNGTRLAVGLTAVMVLGACGDDKKTSVTATTVATTSTTLSQVQLDKQKAGRVVLTAADVPGFTADPPSPSDNNPAFEAALSACVNNDPLVVRIGHTDDPRGAASSDFSKGDALTVGSSVTFGETDDQTRTAISDLSTTTFTSCIGKAYVAGFKDQAGLTNVTATAAKLPALTVGDQSVGYRTTVKFRSQGQNVTVYSDVTFIRSGRALAEFDATTSPTPYPEAERTRLVTALAGRMAAP